MQRSSVNLNLCLLLFLLVLTPIGLAQSRQQIIFDDKGIEMVLVPSSKFSMGATLNHAIAFCESLYLHTDLAVCSQSIFSALYLFSESHLQSVQEYYIDKYEVTLASYLMCVEADVCNLSPVENNYYSLLENPEIPTDIPVTGVTYYDAAVYCAWREARLPTEVEWEYAAAGPQNFPFSWGDETTDIPANYCDHNCFLAENTQHDDGYAKLAPVDAYEEGQSWAGVYNLSGNAPEWTSTRVMIRGDIGSDIRIVKGGSYLSGLHELAVWMRIPTNASIARNNGFRCAKKALSM